jgi:hypothetical protein
MNYFYKIIIILICVLLICVVIFKIINQKKEHYIFIYAKIEPYYHTIFKNLHEKLRKKYEPLLLANDNEPPQHISLEYLTHYTINDNHNIIKTIRDHFINFSNIHAVYKGIGFFILKNKIVIKAEFDSDALDSIENLVSSKIPEVEAQIEDTIDEFRKVPSKIMKLYPNYTPNNTYKPSLHMTLLNVNPFIGEDKLNEIIFFANKYLSNHGIHKFQRIYFQSIEYKTISNGRLHRIY